MQYIKVIYLYLTIYTFECILGARTRSIMSTKTTEFLEPPLDGDGNAPEHNVTRGASEHDHDYISTHRPQSRKRFVKFMSFFKIFSSTSLG